MIIRFTKQMLSFFRLLIVSALCFLVLHETAWSQSKTLPQPFEHQGLWGLEKSGKVLLKPEYDFIGRFSDGLGLVKKGKFFGYINEHGVEVIRPQFEAGFTFFRGHSFIKSNGVFSLINRHGEILGKRAYTLSEIDKALQSAFVMESLILEMLLQTKQFRKTTDSSVGTILHDRTKKVYERIQTMKLGDVKGFIQVLRKEKLPALDLTYVVYRWLAHTIQWQSKTVNVEECFNLRRGSSESIALMYQEILKEFGIQCFVVEGCYARHPDGLLSAYQQPPSNHAWNIIVVDQQWRMVDATMGGGVFLENGLMRKEYSSAFFDMPPAKAIATHFPLMSEAQLLDEPVSFAVFFANNHDRYKKQQTTSKAKQYDTIDSTQLPLPKDSVMKRIRLAMIDNHARSTPQQAEASIESLASYLVQPTTNDFEKARAIFVWVTSHIRYDVDGLFMRRPMRPTDAEGVFLNRETVCEGYKNLTAALCNAMGLKNIKVSGYAKGVRYDPLGDMSKSNHAWNLVKLDGRWYILETTWGSGHLNGDNGKAVQEVEEYYFLPNPTHFAFTHFPYEPIGAQAQLLS